MSNWARRMHRRAATLSDVVTSCGHPNSLPYPRRLEKVKFGVALQEVCKDDIPGPLLVLILKLNKEAPQRRDVFRAPGHQGAMKKLIHFLQTGRLVNVDNYSVYTIASVLKKFLRKIPGGVFGRDGEMQLFAAVQLPEEQQIIEIRSEQSGGTEEAETEAGEEVAQSDNAQQTLQQFWQNVLDDIKKVTAEDFKTQALPLARIKKIMKLDEEVKMISAEAPVMFAKAAEIFIHELTLRAWHHTEDNKRRTLQRNDIAMAISKSDQFDFLIDIVPRHEVKPTKLREDPPRPAHSTEQVSTQPQQSVGQQYIIQPCSQLIQQPTSSGQQANSSAGVSVPQPVALVQQMVSSNGEMQQVPIQLTPSQLNMIRLQVQSNPTQPIIIQAQQQGPQIIQVTSQAQHQPQQHQVYLAQVASQDDS